MNFLFILIFSIILYDTFDIYILYHKRRTIKNVTKISGIYNKKAHWANFRQTAPIGAVVC